jgi:putative transposase
MSNLRIFRFFKTSPEIIHLAVMMYVRYPLSLWNVEDLLHERGASTWRMRPCGSGGTGSGRSSPRR